MNKEVSNTLLHRKRKERKERKKEKKMQDRKEKKTLKDQMQCVKLQELTHLQQGGIWEGGGGMKVGQSLTYHKKEKDPQIPLVPI